MNADREKALYVRTAAALLALLALTMGLSFVDLGAFNFPAAITIAAVKAVLVATIFMELRHSNRLLWALAAASLFWLAILVGGTFADIGTRMLLKFP